MASDVRVTRYGQVGDRSDFGVVFTVGKGRQVQVEPVSVIERERRVLRLGFTNTLVATLATDPSFTLDGFAQQVAEALLASGAADRAHEGYLFQSGGDLGRPESLLAAIGEDLDRFAWPGSTPD